MTDMHGATPRIPPRVISVRQYSFAQVMWHSRFGAVRQTQAIVFSDIRLYSDDDQVDMISESESDCSEQWYELDGQEQEALISLRDARKKLQDSTQKVEAVQGAQENPSMS